MNSRRARLSSAALVLRWTVGVALGAFAVSKIRLGLEPGTSREFWVQWAATVVEGTLAIGCVVSRRRWPLALALLFAGGAAAQAVIDIQSDAAVTCRQCLGAGIDLRAGQRFWLAGAVLLTSAAALATSELGQAGCIDRSNPVGKRVTNLLSLAAMSYLLSVGLQVFFAGF